MSGAEPLLQKLRTVARLVAPVRADSLRQHPSGTRTGPRPCRLQPPAHRRHRSLHRRPTGALPGPRQPAAEFSRSRPRRAARRQSLRPGLAAWLQHHCSLPVRIARDGEPITARGIWLAGSNDHLVFDGQDGTLHYTPHPRETPYRPSVDALFHSLAEPHTGIRVGVLLTGMGRDGADGLLAMRTAGALTIAQDAPTCVVYGMPKAAMEIKAAAEILPLKEIGPRVLQAVLAGLQSESGSGRKSRPEPLQETS